MEILQTILKNCISSIRDIREIELYMSVTQHVPRHYQNDFTATRFILVPPHVLLPYAACTFDVYSREAHGKVDHMFHNRSISLREIFLDFFLKSGRSIRAPPGYSKSHICNIFSHMFRAEQGGWWEGLHGFIQRSSRAQFYCFKTHKTLRLEPSRPSMHPLVTELHRL
jgi:hypothetical protein